MAAGSLSEQRDEIRKWHQITMVKTHSIASVTQTQEAEPLEVTALLGKPAVAPGGKVARLDRLVAKPINHRGKPDGAFCP